MKSQFDNSYVGMQLHNNILNELFLPEEFGGPIVVEHLERRETKNSVTVQRTLNAIHISEKWDGEKPKNPENIGLNRKQEEVGLQVWFRDLSMDHEGIDQEGMIAVATTKERAEWIKDALVYQNWHTGGEPTREFFVK